MSIKEIIKARIQKHSALCCIFSGVIYALSFLNEWLFAFTYVGITSFCLVLFLCELKKPFRHTFCFFVGALPVVYSWFTQLYPFEGFSFTPFQGVIVVILCIIGISLVHSTMISLIFLLSKLIPENAKLLRAPLVAALFVIYEWALNLGPLKFSWGTVAITQIKFLPLIQNASLLGCYFITFIVVEFCAFTALLILEPKKRTMIATVSSMTIPLVVGTVLLCVPVSKDMEIDAAAVQGNALSNEKWDRDKLNEIIDTYISLAEEAASNGAELVALPESAFPTAFTENGAIHKRLADIAIKYDCTIVTGALIFDDDDQKHNAMIAITPSGELTNWYTKRNLVPFGETIPFEKLSNLVIELLGMNYSKSSYVEGSSASIIELDGMKLGGVICYDSIFPWTVRDSAYSGANLFIIVTNDSWFKDSPSVKQHIWHAALRAVENGRFIVRAANTGISCFITPKGQIINQTEPLVKASTYSTVYTVETKTLYTIIGDVPLYLSLAAYAILIILWIIKGVKRHDHN